MKIPAQRPFEKISHNLLLLHGKALVAITTFRTNILTNRDTQHSTPKKFKISDTHEIAIVPYESSAKAVDSDSFTYALESAITESHTDEQATSSNRVSKLFHHPARVIAAIIIIILIGYIAIMATQATAINWQPIEHSKYQKQLQ